jgi:myo-inositol-1-phosphate synthase
MPSLNKRCLNSVLRKGQGFPCPFRSSHTRRVDLSKDEILDQRGRAQDEHDDDQEKEKSKAPAQDKVCIVERYVGHRLILGLKQHDRRSGADTKFERQSHETVSPSNCYAPASLTKR